MRVLPSTLLLAALLAVASCASHAPPASPAAVTPSPQVAQQSIDLVHNVLLLQPPPPATVDELYDVYLIVSERAATGEISPGWTAYIYVNYYRDMVRDRPDGKPRRSHDEVHAEVDRYVEFFYIRKRPEARPSPFGSWIWQVRPQ